MSDLVMPSSKIGDALLHASASAAEPMLIVGEVDDDLQILWANRAFADAACAEVIDLADVPVTSVIRSVDGDLPLNALRVSEFRATLVPRAGVASSWEAVAFPSPGPTDRAWVISLRPAGEGVDINELLRASEERFRVVSERAPIGIFSSEVGLRFGYVNDWFAQLVGVPAEHLLGTGWISTIDGGDVDAVCAGLQETLNGTAFEGPARLTTATGEQRWVTFRAVPVHSPDAPASFLGTVEDVTARRQVEELLSWQASHDPLTGLPNRSQLIEEIAAALADGTDDVAVLFLDLDDFKMVNDSLGHAAGDELLMAVASRLRSAVREGDRVYRFAGDEFVVLARGAGSDIEALGIANRLRATVAEPVTLVHEELQVKCSAGVVRADRHSTPESLLRDADTAMYQAKRHSKGSAALFDPAVRGMLDEDLEFAARVREAISQRSTSVGYRPVMALGADQPLVVALDASIELVDLGGADVDSDTIMEIARQAKLTRPLMMAAIGQICADLAAWRAAGPGEPGAPDDAFVAVGGAPLWVSIAMTPAELLVPGLVDHLARSLVRHRLAGNDFAVRLSFDANVATGGGVRSVLDQLAELGVRISTDETASSHVSLLQLAQPGLGAINLDLSELVQDERSASVIRAVVGLADELHVDVVADHLASDAHVELARRLGIRMGSGPAFGSPVIAAVVPSLFTTGRPG